MTEHQGEDGGQVSLSPDDLKALREKAKEADRLTKENAAAQRELAFVKAKIDITDPKMSYFVKGYDGELTAEAIQAEAQKAGFYSAQQQPQVPAAELEAHQQVGAATSGSGSPEPFDFQAELAKCKTAEEVMMLASKQNLPTVWNRPS